MSTVQQNEEDLLIISDSSDTLDFWGIEPSDKTENNDLTDDFSFAIEEEAPALSLDENLEKKEENENLDFLTIQEDKNEEKEEILSLTEEDTKNSLNDLMWDFNIKEEKETETNIFENSLEEQKTEENFVSDLEFKKETEKQNNSLPEEVWDMSEILSRTISEFEKRENLIEEDISERESHISILEKELNTEKTLVSDLKSEKIALEKNRKSIEKMKNDFENKEDKN